MVIIPLIFASLTGHQQDAASSPWLSSSVVSASSPWLSSSVVSASSPWLSSSVVSASSPWLSSSVVPASSPWLSSSVVSAAVCRPLDHSSDLSYTESGGFHNLSSLLTGMPWGLARSSFPWTEHTGECHWRLSGLPCVVLLALDHTGECH